MISLGVRALGIQESPDPKPRLRISLNMGTLEGMYGDDHRITAVPRMKRQDVDDIIGFMI